ncbi:MAG TPA: hypothetical protein VNT53_04400 [Pseudolysinimonas sp.]|nr:hypothetical protein [Pseudolysinimonas sp.]
MGRYVAPPKQPPTPLEDLVDEGVLIVGSTVRMSIKNRIIVQAMRDHSDFETKLVAAAARSELRKMAEEKREDADRIQLALERALGRSGTALHQSDYRDADVDALALRGETYRALADRLDELSRDADFVRALVERAREQAWDEVSASLEGRLAGDAVSASDPDYLEGLEDRKRLLIAIDLAELRATH